jgi:hypothetical protein
MFDDLSDLMQVIATRLVVTVRLDDALAIQSHVCDPFKLDTEVTGALQRPADIACS